MGARALEALLLRTREGEADVDGRHGGSVFRDVPALMMRGSNVGGGRAKRDTFPKEWAVCRVGEPRGRLVKLGRPCEVPAGGPLFSRWPPGNRGLMTFEEKSGIERIDSMLRPGGLDGELLGMGMLEDRDGRAVMIQSTE